MKNRMKGRDFLTLMDYTKEEITWILECADELKRSWAKGEPHEYLRGKTVAALFEKQSTRTRTSFQAGMAHLGGQSFYMRPDELQLGRGEPIKDTARVIDRYCDALFIRTYGQEIAEEFAEYMKNPVINALTNLTHPCQGLADLLTIKEKKGGFKDLKLAYTGAVSNVCHSLMIGGTIMGIDVYVARPEGYDPDPRPLKFAEEKAKGSGKNLIVTDDLNEAVNNADIVYADAWHAMGTKDKEQKEENFLPFQINEEVLALAKDDFIFMHCLPAYRGKEVTEMVIEGPHSVVWDQAENRMHTEKAILALLVQ